MLAAGAAPEVVKAYVQNWTTPYSISADDVLRLHDKGAPTDVLTAVIRRSGELQAQRAAVAASNAPATASATPENPESESPPSFIYPYPTSYRAYTYSVSVPCLTRFCPATAMTTGQRLTVSATIHGRGTATGTILITLTIATATVGTDMVMPGMAMAIRAMDTAIPATATGTRMAVPDMDTVIPESRVATACRCMAAATPAALGLVAFTRAADGRAAAIRGAVTLAGVAGTVAGVAGTVAAVAGADRAFRSFLLLFVLSALAPAEARRVRVRARGTIKSKDIQPSSAAVDRAPAGPTILVRYAGRA